MALSIGCGSLLAAIAGTPHRMIVDCCETAEAESPAPQRSLLESPDLSGGRGAACDDGDACTLDSGDGAGGCIHASISCDDGILCTRDVCVPPSNWGCVHIPDDSRCTDGVAWNGVETCSATAGCRPGAVEGKTPAS